ncbi:MAG: UDP-N-acetylmuramoyl-tripeptide--D-alanyl-D-alanine ligase [Chloroflexi bacterium]|nr:UDP-N-acetylmuramoyl-tripeptide--D-alanyl-D-alanine ligase [Chloroflexota bacterium]
MTGHLTTGFVAKEMSAAGYRVIAGPDLDVTGGAADSRRVRPGDLFTAFRGENVDGNAFVGDALRAGAVAAICERAPVGDWPGATVIVVPEATVAVGRLAHAWRQECNPRVVGITGTVGKTTAKDLTAAVIGRHFATHKSEGNLNSREGLPLALMSLRRDHRVSVLELAMDSRGEIFELCAIARPEIGIVLNVGLTHVEKLGSIEAIQAEKLALARYLPASGTAIVNADDRLVAPVADELSCRVISFGECRRATLRRGPVTDLGLNGTTFDVTFEGQTVAVASPLPGAHVVPAALAAIGAGVALGMTLEDAAAGVRESGISGRARIVQAASGATIVDDRYNSSPASLNGALRMLGGLAGRRIALLGRMAELGAFEAEEHRRAGRTAAECCDILVAVGETARTIVEEAAVAGHPDARWFATKEDAAVAVARELRAGDFLLVKASRAMAFETILPILEGQP